MGDHRAQAQKNGATVKQEVKPSFSNVRRSLSGLPENHLSKSIADSHDQQVAVSQASGFFDFGSISIFPKSKTPVGLNSQALPIQAKLKIGQPNDKYEQEADRVAEQVMRMPDPKVQRQAESEEEEPIQTESITPLVQRQPEPEEEEEEAVPEREEDSTPILESAPTIDDDELDEEETVQTKSLTNKPAIVRAGLQNQIHSLKGGQPLPGAERAFFEPRFGADFSKVRIHNDPTAANMARSINAKAFTKGRDVVFGNGEYAPGTSSGRRLLAHELTHVQQQGGSNKIGFKTSIESNPIDSQTLQKTSNVQRSPETNLYETRPPDLPYKPYHSEMEAGFRAMQELKHKLPPEPSDSAKEWGTEIFRVNTQKGSSIGALYSFMPLTEATKREWHPIGRIPHYAEVTAIAHTHPAGGRFTKQDVDLALGLKAANFYKKITVFMVNQKGMYWVYGRDPGGVKIDRSKRKGHF